jgi:CRISPR system Cascade subunit CasB
MRRRFSNPAHETERKALKEWYDALQKNTGARARLRRAATPDDVAFEPELHRLLALLRPGFNVQHPTVRRKLQALAGLAARVREHSDESSFARQMAPVVSEPRFRRLLTTTSLEDRYAQLARVIQLLKGRVNLWSLADAVYDWDDDPDLRQQWAYEYYEAAPS